MNSLKAVVAAISLLLLVWLLVSESPRASRKGTQEMANVEVDVDPLLFNHVDKGIRDQVYGLMVAVALAPDDLSQAYSALSTKLNAFDPSIYVYPHAHLHSTVATLVSFKSDTLMHASKETRLRYQSIWKSYLAEAFTEAQQQGLMTSNSFTMTAKSLFISKGAAGILYENPSGEIAGIRQAIKKALAKINADHPDIICTSFNVPNIIHSSIVRFRKQPEHGFEELKTRFEKEIASQWTPLPVQVKEISLMIEDSPYMHVDVHKNKFETFPLA